MANRSRTSLETERKLRLARAARGVKRLRHAAHEAEREFARELNRVAPAMRASARNLVHYLAVRRHDIRGLQDELARLGLSSLGRMEAHVMASLDAVASALHALRHERDERPEAAPAPFQAGDALLAKHADAVLGAVGPGRKARIMVTMPGHAARDPALIRQLVEEGMGIMRINCAHDSPREWKAMVGHLRRACRKRGRKCRVSFDLAGPKLRTGPIAGPDVLKWKPERDEVGRVTAPARVRLVAHPHALAPNECALSLASAWLAKAQRGDIASLIDARGRLRVLRIVEATASACECETDTTAYLAPGTRLTLTRKGKALAEGTVLAVPPRDAFIELRRGDTLELVRGNAPGHAAVRRDDGLVLQPATVACALPEVFARVREGEPALFDDGKVRGVVRRRLADRLRIEITNVVGACAKLRGEKGINLPESELDLPALTRKDLDDLDFIVRHGDMVALSFVQRRRDVERLLAALARRRARRLDIVLKVETRAGFERLPALLLAAMRHGRVAVMAARGDLGVEVGFERLSEVQEEILWLSEAAHVPVIWATQVLESLAKGGMPSRAEVTDAAMGSRAECVMLNKGPYIRETMRFLIDVLHRMEGHQHKKTARLRRLRVSRTPRIVEPRYPMSVR